MREIIKKYVHGVYVGDERVRSAVTPEYLSDIKSAYKVNNNFVSAVAPQVRLELTTLRLTAECSAIELLRNVFLYRIPLVAPRLALCFCIAYRSLKLGSRYVFVLHNAHATQDCNQCNFFPKIKFDRMQNLHLTFGHPLLVFRRRPIFPEGHPSSIVSAEELNCCVRYGNRWILFAITTGISQLFPFLPPFQAAPECPKPSKLHNPFFTSHTAHHNLVRVMFLCRSAFCSVKDFQSMFSALQEP